MRSIADVRESWKRSRRSLRLERARSAPGATWTPHIVQPFEIYHGCPIFYSVGNFTFGSRNSHAEGLLVAIRFEEAQTTVNVYPLYVKNRDPRVRFQPKVLRGAGADRALRTLAEISGPAGAELTVEAGRGILRLHRSGADRAA